jgi:hypothetical protein
MTNKIIESAEAISVIQFQDAQLILNLVALMTQINKFDLDRICIPTSRDQKMKDNNAILNCLYHSQ